MTDAPKKPHLSIRAVVRGTFRTTVTSYGSLVLLGLVVGLVDIPDGFLPRLLSFQKDQLVFGITWSAALIVYSLAVRLPVSAFAFALVALRISRGGAPNPPPVDHAGTIRSALAVLPAVMGAMLPMALAQAVSTIVCHFPWSHLPEVESWHVLLLRFGIGILALNIVMLILVLLFCVAPVAASLERMGARAALARSVRLTRRCRGRIFIGGLLFGFLPAVMSSFIVHALPHGSGAAIAWGVYLTFAAAFIAPLWWAFTYTIYVELKKIKEVRLPDPGSSSAMISSARGG